MSFIRYGSTACISYHAYSKSGDENSKWSNLMQSNSLSRVLFNQFTAKSSATSHLNCNFYCPLNSSAFGKKFAKIAFFFMNGYEVVFPRDGTSRDKLGRDVPLSLCPGTKKFSCPGALLSRDKGRSKNPETKSSVPGHSGNEFIFT